MTDEQKQLVADNHNLIYSFLKKYRLNIEEWYDVAAIGLCNAAINYNGSLSAFATYAYTCMYSEFAKAYKFQHRKRCIPNDCITYYEHSLKGEDNKDITYLDVIPSDENIEDEAIMRLDVNDTISKLSDREKQVVALLDSGYTQSKIAEIVGCSRQNISDIKIRLRKRFKDYL